MTDVPQEIAGLADLRERARADRDFALADSLRERIRRAGFEVVDTVQGPVVSRKRQAAGEAPVPRPRDVVSLLDRPPAFDATVHWLAQGWPDDVVRGMASFDRFHPSLRVQQVVVDTGESGGETWPEGVDVVRLAADPGWAAARNAGLVRTAGRMAVVVDGSIEATGDVLGPLIQALVDPSVGVTGPFGVVSDDLREFREAQGGECDAIEGYLMAFGRDLLLRGVRFDPKFRFYRTADIELSFQVKALGLRATVTMAPVLRHQHRTWANTAEDVRARLSKRNFYRFLDRWRGRTDLLVSGGRKP